MELSKQRRVYVGILGLALAGLTVDRLFLESGATEPGTAAAAGTPGAAPAKPDAARSSPSDRVQSSARATLNQLSADLSGRSGIVRDVFVAPPDWFQDREIVAPAPTPERATSGPAATYRLGAVIANQAAVINGIPIKVGESKPSLGLTLISADQMGVYVEVRGRRIRLERETAIGGSEEAVPAGGGEPIPETSPAP